MATAIIHRPLERPKTNSHDSIVALAASIEANGVLQNLVVRTGKKAAISSRRADDTASRCGGSRNRATSKRTVR